MKDNDAGFFDVIYSPEFEAAWQRIIDEPVTYDEFCAMPLPPGVDRHDLWGALSLLKRCMGESNDLTPWFLGVSNDLCWSYTPKSVERDLFELSSLISPASLLNAHIRSQDALNPVILENIVDEVASVARRDGLPLNRDTVRELWILGRHPHNKYELIIQNAKDLFAKVPVLAKRKYSALLADDIHDELMHGAEDVSLIRKLHFESQYYDLSRVNDPVIAENALHSCLAQANDAASLRDIVLAAVLTANVLWDVSAWPTCNALTEFLLRSVLFARKNVPALSYIPLSSKDTAGKEGFGKMHERESRNTHSQGLDSTWLYAGQVKILLEGARDLLSKIQQLENEDARVRDKIEDVPWLNFRQKNLLLALRRAPHRFARIKDYADGNKIAYATARQDLLELEEHGLLVKEKHERTFAYRLSHRINW